MKLVGVSTISFGLLLSLIEWFNDFKINGWSWAVVFSTAVFMERLHHNRQMRIMLKQIGDKVGVKWNAESYNFNLSMARKMLRFGRTMLSPALFAMLFTHRKVTDKSRLSKETKKMKLFTSPWSKKLFAFLLLVLVNGLNDALGLHLTPDAITHITNVGGIYILAQAGVDALKPVFTVLVGMLAKSATTTTANVLLTPDDPNKFITP